MFDAAQTAVMEVGWNHSWHIDADHINLNTVDRFIACSDFFTIDVADSIGKPAVATDVHAFLKGHPELIGVQSIPGVGIPFTTTRAEVERVVAKYLLAVRDAGRIYRHIAAAKGEDKIIAEVSMDETDLPQTPPELLIILVLMADEKVRVKTSAVKSRKPFGTSMMPAGLINSLNEEELKDLLAYLLSGGNEADAMFRK